LVAARQQGPGTHAGRIGNAGGRDVAVVTGEALPLCELGTEVRLVPNAARS